VTLRPCLGPPGGASCPTSALVRDGNRCPTCRPTTTQRGLGSDYQRLRAQVVAEEAACWLCDLADLYAHDPRDVWTADHVVPRARGGRLVRSNLRKAHKSCNSSRGKG
jgi:5-methylcytosine-specific restriction endonuclease McrA